MFQLNMADLEVVARHSDRRWRAPTPARGALPPAGGAPAVFTSQRCAWMTKKGAFFILYFYGRVNFDGRFATIFRLFIYNSHSITSHHTLQSPVTAAVGGVA